MFQISILKDKFTHVVLCLRWRNSFKPLPPYWVTHHQMMTNERSVCRHQLTWPTVRPNRIISFSRRPQQVGHIVINGGKYQRHLLFVLVSTALMCKTIDFSASLYWPAMTIKTRRRSAAAAAASLHRSGHRRKTTLPFPQWTSASCKHTNMVTMTMKFSRHLRLKRTAGERRSVTGRRLGTPTHVGVRLYERLRDIRNWGRKVSSRSPKDFTEYRRHILDTTTSLR